MPFADVQDLRMHYELAGRDSLPVVVFSHSLGANLAMWDLQADALAGQFRILRYDARGHGQSAGSQGPLSIEDLALDVLRLLDFLKIPQVSFCGLSMGGSIGQWLGIHAPTRLRKLILANTAARIGTVEVWDARIATVAAQGLAPVIPGTLERWFTAEYRLNHAATVSAIRKMLEGTDVDGYAACCTAIRDADFRGQVSQISTPTLVIGGIDDPVTTLADAQFLALAIQGARFVALPAAHLSNLGAASEFNTALLSFLRD